MRIQDFLAVLLFVFASQIFAQPAETSETVTTHREVAITIDDLPVATTIRLSKAGYLGYSEKLVEKISSLEVPVYGFVIASRVQVQGEASLKVWLDAGISLGNHTFSHPDLNSISAAALI